MDVGGTLTILERGEEEERDWRALDTGLQTDSDLQCQALMEVNNEVTWSCTFNICTQWYGKTVVLALQPW